MSATMLSRSAPGVSRVFSGQTVAMTAVIVVVAGFVLYPIYYLVQA